MYMQANGELEGAKNTVKSLEKLKRDSRGQARNGPAEWVASQKDRHTQELYRAVQDATGWDQMPVGPLGA